MDIFTVSASFLAGVVVGIIIEKAMKLSKDSNTIDKEKLLEECFGEHMYVGKFSLVQVRDWIKIRQESLNNGAKATVMKITPEILQKLGKDINISQDMNNYLVIAIMNNVTGKMEESILVKYDELDEKLEDMLAKGDGILVVNGG